MIARRRGVPAVVRRGSESFAAVLRRLDPSRRTEVCRSDRAFEGRSDFASLRAGPLLVAVGAVSSRGSPPAASEDAGGTSFVRHSLVAGSITGRSSRNASAAGFGRLTCRVVRQGLIHEPPLPSGFAPGLVCRGVYRYTLRTVASEAALPSCCIAAVDSQSLPGNSFAPPSTCSWASTPPMTSLPSVRSTVSQAVDLVSSSWFRTTSTTYSALGRFEARFRGWLRCVLESRACCIPLPILGFAAFLAVHQAVIAHRPVHVSPQRGSCPSK
jgi:hypothetical protein